MTPLIAFAETPANPITVWAYLAYLAISIALTVWVARTLHKNGRIFLVDSFLDNEALADSVNHHAGRWFLPREHRFRNSSFEIWGQGSRCPNRLGDP